MLARDAARDTEFRLVEGCFSTRLPPQHILDVLMKEMIPSEKAPWDTELSPE